MNYTVITRNIHVNLYTTNKQEQLVKSQVKAKTKVYCPSFKAEMLWLKSHASLFGCRWACIRFLYFFFVSFSGFEGHDTSFGHNKKRNLMTFQNSKTDCQGVRLQAICNVDVPEFRLLNLPPRLNRLRRWVRIRVFFSCVNVLHVRVRALSLRSLTRPGPHSRSRSLPCTPPLPASRLDQWVTCMSNSPLEHTRRPARTRSKTHTYANTAIIFKVHSSTGMRFHVPLQKHTHMHVTLRVPEWQMLRSGLRFGF